MKVSLRVISADISAFFEALLNKGVRIGKVKMQDAMTGSFCTDSKYVDLVFAMADIRGDLCEIRQMSGPILRVTDLRHRWPLALCAVILLLLTLLIPERILFVQVIGNSSVPTHKILLAAENCGIFFGAKRDAIRSVEVKNYLLNKIPEIGWACVNTNGCVASICVIEQVVQNVAQQQSEKTVGIYAATDGVVLRVIVDSGYSQIAVGDAVKEGQLLVSGVQSDGNNTKCVYPRAEIFASTARQLRGFYAEESYAKAYLDDSQQRYYLLFGKKRINLRKDSRISTTKCDKIYAEYYLTLPGGYTLPLGIAIETVACYDLVEQPDQISKDRAAIDFMDQYIREQMVSGRIVSRFVERQTNNTIDVRYHCVEMIGRERVEEYDLSNGKDD